LILPAAIVGFVGASEIDRAVAAHRAAALRTLQVESRPGPTASNSGAPTQPVQEWREESKPAPSIPVPMEKTANLKPAKKKRRRVTPQQVAPPAPSSDPDLPAAVPTEAERSPASADERLDARGGEVL
jgi:hypothetical protein